MRDFKAVLTKYKLNPESRDIYVEGPSDKDFFSYFFNKCENCTDVEFIDIESIDFKNVANDILEKGYDGNSNRDKVIYLMERLEKEKACYTRGIIDKDVLSHTRGLPKNQYILHTDNSCLEMYFFSKENVEKVQKLSFSKISNATVEKIMKDLVVLSALRIMEKRENIPLTKPKEEKDFVKYLNYVSKEKCVEFNFEKYLNVLFMNYNTKLNKERRKIEKKIQEYKKEIDNDDIRDNLNGHEFIYYLTYCIQKYEGKKGAKVTSETVCEIYKNAVDPLLLKNTELFKNLRKFIEKQIA